MPRTDERASSEGAMRPTSAPGKLTKTTAAKPAPVQIAQGPAGSVNLPKTATDAELRLLAGLALLLAALALVLHGRLRQLRSRHDIA